MPREEDIIDEGEDLDFDPEFDHLFYSAGLDDCLFKESEYCSMFDQIGDQNMWNEHSSNECDISFCGGMTRAWNEGKTEIETTNSAFDDMITKIAFGHNTAAAPDLAGLMIGYDRGYVFRDFVAKMMDSGTCIHSTLKRCPWAPISYDQNGSENDKRYVIPSTDIPTYWPEYKAVRLFYSKQAEQEEVQQGVETATEHPLPSPTNPVTNANPIDPSLKTTVLCHQSIFQQYAPQ